jgi:hypothetical protein
VSRMNCVASRANWLSGIFTPEISLTIMVHLHQYQVRPELTPFTSGPR